MNSSSDSLFKQNKSLEKRLRMAPSLLVENHLGDNYFAAIHSFDAFGQLTFG
jgi:hypothetical protein